MPNKFTLEQKGSKITIFDNFEKITLYKTDIFQILSIIEAARKLINITEEDNSVDAIYEQIGELEDIVTAIEDDNDFFC